MVILGISAYYHDSAACILLDGKIIAAVQEERLSRLKHDSGFPHHAIKYCLEAAGVELDEIDKIVFYDKPFTKFERIIENHISNAPMGLQSYLASMPSWLGEKFNFKKYLNKGFKKHFNQEVSNILFSDHHLSHGASSFYTSPFSEAAVVTLDGVGEWTTLSIAHYTANSVEVIKELHYPNSIGLFYSAFTYFCGFRVNSGEYKLMGLAPYGNPESEETKSFYEKLKNNILHINDDGSVELNLEYFAFTKKLKMLNDEKVENLLGIKRRIEEDELTQSYCNLALAIQMVTENCILKVIKHTKEIIPTDNLCLAGGVALNCVANQKIQDANIFSNIYIQPAAGDAGGAMGAALAYYYSQNEYKPTELFNPYLGPFFSEKEIQSTLLKFNAQYTKFEDTNELISKTTDLIKNKKIIGWFQDAMEWGPRALGNRSIIADPQDEEMQKKLNLKIKYRESFRPFAPIVLKEDAGEYFKNCSDSPYMLFTYTVNEKKLIPIKENLFELKLIDRLKIKRSEVSAITHLDFSARVQTVSKDNNHMLHRLLSNYKEKTNCSVLINTSFNVRGEPIVCTPEDALRCFMNTELDALVLNNFLLVKESQKDFKTNKFKEVTLIKD